MAQFQSHLVTLFLRHQIRYGMLITSAPYEPPIIFGWVGNLVVRSLVQKQIAAHCTIVFLWSEAPFKDKRRAPLKGMREGALSSRPHILWLPLHSPTRIHQQAGHYTGQSGTERHRLGFNIGAGWEEDITYGQWSFVKNKNNARE